MWAVKFWVMIIVLIGETLFLVLSFDSKEFMGGWTFANIMVCFVSSAFVQLANFSCFMQVTFALGIILDQMEKLEMQIRSHCASCRDKAELT